MIFFLVGPILQIINVDDRLILIIINKVLHFSNHHSPTHSKPFIMNLLLLVYTKFNNSKITRIHFDYGRYLNIF